MTKAAIIAVKTYLPEIKRANEDLERINPTWSSEDIYKKTGIRSRHIAGDDECVSDMAIKAGRKLLDLGIVDPREIDVLMVCTQTPDYLLPTTACLVQCQLGFPTKTAAFDFNLGCSGFPYGLWMARAFILSGQANAILLITADTYSKYCNLRDKTVCTIFGDGATATLIKAVSDDSIGEIRNFLLGTDGSGVNNLIIPAGGARLPSDERTAENIQDEAGNFRSKNDIYMNGPEIFRFSIVNVPRAIHQFLEKEKLSFKDIDLVFFHQANIYILEHLRRKLNLPIDKMPLYLEDVGNTVSSTIPLTIQHTQKQGILQPGHLCLLVGFGVGYSWGVGLVRWGEAYV